MRWIFPNLQSDQIRTTMEHYKVPESIAKVMVSRKLTDLDQTKEFFSPSIALLHNPF